MLFHSHSLPGADIRQRCTNAVTQLRSLRERFAAVQRIGERDDLLSADSVRSRVTSDTQLVAQQHAVLRGCVQQVSAMTAVASETALNLAAQREQLANQKKKLEGINATLKRGQRITDKMSRWW